MKTNRNIVAVSVVWLGLALMFAIGMGYFEILGSVADMVWFMPVAVIFSFLWMPVSILVTATSFREKSGSMLLKLLLIAQMGYVIWVYVLLLKKLFE